MFCPSVQCGEIVLKIRFPLRIAFKPRKDAPEHPPKRGEEQDSGQYLCYRLTETLFHLDHSSPTTLS